MLKERTFFIHFFLRPDIGVKRIFYFEKLIYINRFSYFCPAIYNNLSIYNIMENLKETVDIVVNSRYPEMNREDENYWHRS